MSQDPSPCRNPRACHGARKGAGESCSSTAGIGLLLQKGKLCGEGEALLSLAFMEDSCCYSLLMLTGLQDWGSILGKMMLRAEQNRSHFVGN